MAVDVLEKWGSHQTKSIRDLYSSSFYASLAARVRACACAFRMQNAASSFIQAWEGKTLHSFSIRTDGGSFRREHTPWTSSWSIWEALNSEYNCACNIYSRRRVCGPYFFDKAIVFTYVLVLCLAMDVDNLCTFTILLIISQICTLGSRVK